MNFSTPEKSTILSNFREISSFDIPRIAAFRKTFSLPVSSGWKPVPTSNKLVTRPFTRTRPPVGAVIRLRILSSVLFPAPFFPIIPKTSPDLTSIETSFKAQNMSSEPPSSLNLLSFCKRLKLESGYLTHEVRAPMKVSWSSSFKPMR